MSQSAANPLSSAHAFALRPGWPWVAGLAYNPVDYELSPIDTVTYTRTLQIPDQAVIRYVYVRYPSATQEDTNLDQPIRYRLFYASGNTQIIDTVSSWTDKPVNTLSGSIFGAVVNADTNQPIPDILVTAGGEQSLTDSAGRFLLSGLRAGTHNLVAYALAGSYQVFQQGAAVADNQVTQAAQIRLKQLPQVNVTFIVSIPQGTQGALRIAGSLLQFGNTFADLRGGLSTVADRMPILQLGADGRYTPRSVSLLARKCNTNTPSALGIGIRNSLRRGGSSRVASLSARRI